MADLTDTQFLNQDPEVLGLQRQRQLANLLTDADAVNPIFQGLASLIVVLLCLP